MEFELPDEVNWDGERRKPRISVGSKANERCVINCTPVQAQTADVTQRCGSAVNGAVVERCMRDSQQHIAEQAPGIVMYR
jgi:hypothetical protein